MIHWLFPLMFLCGFCITWATRSTFFRTCKNKRLNSVAFASRLNVSQLRCGVECSKTEQCNSAVFKRTHKKCELFCEVIDSHQCSSLDSEENTNLLLKVHTSGAKDWDAKDQNVNPCKNNQTFNGTNCLCRPPLTGEYCEYGPRDCSYVSGIGWFDIYPEDGLGKIRVACYTGCLFAFAAPTGGFSLKYTNVPWAAYKVGFGEPEMNPLTLQSIGYWLGNDHLHRITNGSISYDLVYEAQDTSVRYEAIYYGVSVGSENKNYSMHYKAFASPGKLDQVMPIDQPFSTRDRNDAACANFRNTGFWYNAHCSNYPPFFGYFKQLGRDIAYNVLFACLRQS